MPYLFALLLIAPFTLAGGSHHNDHNEESVSNSQSIDSDNQSSNSTVLEVSPTSANSNDVVVSGDSNSQQSSTIYRDAERSAESAPSVIAQICQSGASGQTRDGGFSIVNSDQLCDYWKAAEISKEAYLFTVDHCEPIKCKVDCLPEGYVMGELNNCQSDALKYLAEYHLNLDSAQSLLDSTKHVSWLDRIAGYLVRPMAVIGLLVWLL